MCNKRKIYATATIYGCVVECEEGWGGCGTVVRGGVRLGGGGRPLYELKVWGLSCSCVGRGGRVLLSLCLQEMATVSAVSLTANEFPVGGVAAAHVRACVDGCLDMRWGGSTAAWK